MTRDEFGRKAAALNLAVAKFTLRLSESGSRKVREIRERAR